MSYFQSLFSQQWQLEKHPEDDSIFIDRDGTLFRYILQYFRTGLVPIDLNDALLRRDLTNEAKFYKIDSLVQLLETDSEEKKLYLDTKILSLNYQIELNRLFGNNNQQWKLIYRGSRDGYTAKVFHQLCDNKGATMTVIRAQNGCIFGGFTSISWSSVTTDKADPSAFLFTLKNPFEIPPTKYPIHQRAIDFAVTHKSKTDQHLDQLQTEGVIYSCIVPSIWLVVGYIFPKHTKIQQVKVQ